MQTETSPYGATEYRDVLARLALQRANIMHLVDLKRGAYSRGAQRCGSTASPIGHSQFRSYRKVYPLSLDVLTTGRVRLTRLRFLRRRFLLRWSFRRRLGL
jgi:hypothetical protein